MKITISVDGPSLDAKVDPLSGRCRYPVIFHPAQVLRAIGKA